MTQQPEDPDEVHASAPTRRSMIGIAIGAGLPVLLAIAIVALGLEHLLSLLLTFAAFFAGAFHAARRDADEPWRLVGQLSIPTVVLFGMFALNAESWLLLTVPAAALVASVAGVMLGRRWRARRPVS